MQKSVNNNKFKISVSKWNKKFELPDGSHSVSDIQNYFRYVIKKHDKLTRISPVKIYVNKIANTIAFKTETGYYLELLALETMKLRRSTKNKITKNINKKTFLFSKILKLY